MADCLIEKIQALMLTGDIAEIHIQGLQPLVRGDSRPEFPVTYAAVAVGVSALTGRFRIHLEKTVSLTDLVGTLAMTIQELEDTAKRHAETDA